MTTRKIEIMSPVGSYESLMAAIQGGADSVYFGASRLNMRSRSSNNFTLEDLQKIAKICKQNNVRSYLTLNTVVYDEDIELMKETVDTAKKCGVTAIIASDLSAITYAHKMGLEVHISTQCNITNIEAVRFFSQYADVMVTARELSLEQVANLIKEIEKQNIRGPKGNLVEIEVFAHGALCMAVSGKCYLSLDNYNESANRGACLQLCRRPYKITDLDGGVELVVENQYIMSPKDLCTIDVLDKIISAGVKVLKIEGRGRSPEYVKKVTSVYKQATQAYFENDYTSEKIEKWTNELKTVYNRGFWHGYYMGQKLGEWTEKYGSQATQKKVYIGKISNYFQQIGVAELKVETGELNVGDKIIISGPTTGVYESEVLELRLDLKPVVSVKKGDVCSLPIPEFLRRGDQLYKVVQA